MFNSKKLILKKFNNSCTKELKNTDERRWEDGNKRNTSNNIFYYIASTRNYNFLAKSSSIIGAMFWIDFLLVKKEKLILLISKSSTFLNSR